jgi:hypothetical protein
MSASSLWLLLVCVFLIVGGLWSHHRARPRRPRLPRRVIEPQTIDYRNQANRRRWEREFQRHATPDRRLGLFQFHPPRG